MPVDLYPPDFDSDIGGVRALIPDVEQVDFSGSGVPEYLFSDVHLAGLLRRSRGSANGKIFRAAAAATRALAVSEGMISKVIKTEDLQTDGAKLATALLGAAKQLEEEAARADEEEDELYGFAIVDFQPQPADYLPYSMRGFPQPCCIGSRVGGCGCGSRDMAAGFGSGVV